MQPADLKIEFEKQLKDADSKIAAAEIVAPPTPPAAPINPPTE